MKKIDTQYEKDKKRRTNQFIVGGILIFIMLFSILGYAFQGSDDSNAKKIIYNNFEFIQQENYWVLNNYGENNLKFTFKNNPKEIEGISSNVNDFNNYLNKPLYIYSEKSEAEIEIYNNLNSISQRIQHACLDKEENLLGELKCEDNLPIKNCEDNFIVIKESNNSKIIQKVNCVFIQVAQENLTKITDEFLFKTLKIIK